MPESGHVRSDARFGVRQRISLCWPGLCRCFRRSGGGDWPEVMERSVEL